MISITIEAFALIHEKDGTWSTSGSGIISYIYSSIPLDVIPFSTHDAMLDYIAENGIEVAE